MMAAAKKQQLDVVLVWRYDRFARSTQALFNALKEFQSLGVGFISYQENIDTTTPTGELVFHVMASLAQFESALISPRVRAGMARAKAQGKHTARPPAGSGQTGGHCPTLGRRLIYELSKQAVRRGLRHCL
ncbi:recombinase family protein [Hymenobacter psychrophilus]|uniref:Resolvase, N terminal domain n=1 Tax=Hymenobacter psychrophilus TaxID=651662 RepID=A0A1H3MUC2_9BACT|nr:recombinase family protein [Hymenobacter psychrophilus]SDY80060.1 Resolvase, N terminal domain [Hymenobacter psychrophilus]